MGQTRPHTALADTPYGQKYPDSDLEMTTRGLTFQIWDIILFPGACPFRTAAVCVGSSFCVRPLVVFHLLKGRWLPLTFLLLPSSCVAHSPPIFHPISCVVDADVSYGWGLFSVGPLSLFSADEVLAACTLLTWDWVSNSRGSLIGQHCVPLLFCIYGWNNYKSSLCYYLVGLGDKGQKCYRDVRFSYQ